MPASTSPTPSSFSNEDQNLSNIFIGREQQIDLFTFYLNRWQQMMADSEPDDTLVTAAPSPDNKLQGLLVLLYGRGGFGKSTLLRRFSKIAQASDRHLTADKPIDWEFAIEGKRGLFNPPPGQEMDATDYYQALCGHLAISLNKQPQDFKQYQIAVKAVEKARKEAQGVVDNLQKDDRYGWVRGISIELVKLAVGTYLPGSGVFMELPIVKSATDGAAKLTQDQIKSLRDKLQDKLGSKLGDYLDAGLRLGLALGRDLHDFARNFPLLFFFDTYEEIDEGDHLLRVVMGSAGKRVGWVIAGRDNLWAGPGQIERSISIEYGYKELIPTDRGLSIDFNTGGIGAFTLSDIKDYFALIWQKYNLTRPHLSESDLKRILDVTSGVPLAVKIAAGLYLDTESLETVTEAVAGKRTIIDQMVRRYLLHARDSQEERAKLYGLAMLRRADQPTAVSAALNLTPEQAQTSYASELSRLHRRYSFIFTEKEEPALHQEVRSFLRQWLLEHRKDPEVIAINKRLKAAQKEVLKDLEERMSYTSLQERLEDEEWVSAYLDLTEQQYWFDPVEGVRTILPFMMAAAIYRRAINDDAANIGTFFETSVRAPYQDWWKWAEQSLIYLHSRTLSHQELKGLEQLEKLTQQRCPAFPPPIPDYRQELQAAIWWRLGEAYQDKDDPISLAWYKQALTKLGHMEALKEATARVTRSVAIALSLDKRFDEMIPLLDSAIELIPYEAQNYHFRGIAYNNLKDYHQAIGDYSQAIALDPGFAGAYNNRGIAYHDLKDYHRAIGDFDKAIALDPGFARAYYNRGNAYGNLKDYHQAIDDFDKAIALDPDYAMAYYNRGFTLLWLKNLLEAKIAFHRAHELDSTNVIAAWMTEWANMNKQRPDQETITHLESLIDTDPQHYISHICRGITLGLHGKVKEGLAEMELAIPIEPEEWDAYFWKGMLLAYYYQSQSHWQEAIAAIEQSLTLEMPPILLTPLYWLEKDKPAFFEKYAKPLLERYDI